MIANQEYAEMLAEVYSILNTMEKELIDKIPNKLLRFIRENKSNKYIPGFDMKKTLYEKEEVKKETREFLAYIYYTYWCNEEEKKKYQQILNENEKTYQQRLRAKYNPDNIFKYKMEKKLENKTDFNQNTSLIEIREKWYTRLFSRLKKAFM